MFYYYGRKKRIAHLYPAPVCETLIEPFAGSAAYSLHGDYWKKQVILSDINPVVIGVWRYLQSASEKDVLALPDLKPGEKTTDYTQLSTDERNLIGFHINPGSSSPKITCSRFSRWGAGKKYIVESLYKIKHWQIILGSYCDIPNQTATWFIDPPYQKAGIYYAGGNPLDYRAFGLWCREREGQVLVCEAEGADWMPFRFLIKTKNAGKHSCQEVVWTN